MDADKCTFLIAEGGVSRLLKRHPLAIMYDMVINTPVGNSNTAETDPRKPGVFETTVQIIQLEFWVDPTVPSTCDRSSNSDPSFCKRCAPAYAGLHTQAGRCAHRLEGWEIMSTKGAPGALDWVSLLPFLPSIPLSSPSPLFLWPFPTLPWDF